MAKSYRKFLVGATTAAVVASSFAGVAGAAGFNDVPAQYQTAVDYLVSKGISGTSATTFGTYENIKRVDAAVFVVKALGLNTETAPASGFTDVPERAVKAVNALKAAGITSGKTASTFGAQDYITRGELAIWIQKGYELQAGHEALAFADVSDRYADAVNALVSNKVTNGTSATSFGTYDNAKRGDFAIFLQRANDAKKPPVVVKPSALKIEGDNTGNSLVNGSSKTYTVTFTNPVSGKPMVNEIVNVTFEENLNTNFEQQRKVTVTNASGQSVIPYQSNNGQEAAAQIRTDKDGKATFTITGTNATVTPIAFVDGSNQYWDANAGHRDFKVYADDRFDKETEIFVKAPAVTFGAVAYKIAVTGERTNEATVSEVALNALLLL